MKSSWMISAVCLVFATDQMQYDVVIAGGGLSGLYMAYRILKNNAQTSVCLLEKESRLGGRLYDYFFQQRPSISVGLGGWRVDSGHPLLRGLIQELQLEALDWAFEGPYRYESRGIFSDNSEVLKQAYPALRDSTFGQMNRSQLSARAWSDTTNIGDYSTVNSFVSHRITPEGAQFLSEVEGYKGDYTDFIGPAGYYEWLEATAGFTGNYGRPPGGLSSVVNALVNQLNQLGAVIHTSIEVRDIRKDPGGYSIYTTQQIVTAAKVVLAIPPLQLQRLIGPIAQQLRHSPVFQSIQAVPAMKGAALFPPRTWSDLTQHQNFISNSDCLGHGFLHRGSTGNEEDVMHTIYVDGHCARMWRDTQRLGKDVLDREVHRALEYKYQRTIPTPLETVYQYWDGAWHFQKGGTSISMANVAEWAARPLQGEEIFVVGEAYALKRTWCEGVMDSCNNALAEGWQINQHATRKTLKKKMTKEQFLAHLRRRKVPVSHS